MRSFLITKVVTGLVIKVRNYAICTKIHLHLNQLGITGRLADTAYPLCNGSLRVFCNVESPWYY